MNFLESSARKCGVSLAKRARRAVNFVLCAWLAATLIAMVSPAVAEVYKWKLPDGSIEYSDTPSDPDAVRVDLPQIQTYSAPPMPREAASDSVDDESEPFRGYESVKIMLPAEDATFRDNSGVIPVQASVVPGLRADHRVEMLFDGAVVGQSLTVTLRNVLRGSHSVAVVIKDAGGKVVARSDSVRFHVKRTFRN